MSGANPQDLEVQANVFSFDSHSCINICSHCLHHAVPEIREMRSSAESQLECGVPNMDYVFKQEDSATSHPRRKRLVGGEEALPVSLEI